MVGLSFQFAELDLDLERYELRRAGKRVKLEKIPMELLIALVQAEGRLVTRQELVNRLWGPDMFVDTEHGINTAVRKLRQALGDKREDPRFVQTVTGRGYRFIAPVRLTAALAPFESAPAQTLVQSNGNSAGLDADQAQGKIEQREETPEARARITLSARKRLVLVSIALVFLAMTTLVALVARQNAKVHWAREQAVPEITDSIASRDYSRAFSLAREAEKYIPRDPRLVKLWPSFSGPVTIHTTPEGADIYIKPYKQPSSVWEYVGRSPIEKGRMPIGFFRWKVERPGLASVEVARFAGFPGETHELKFQLFTKESSVPGMVYVPGGSFSLDMAGFDRNPEIDLEGYWIDKFEVTNREYKAFVDAGGYVNRTFWKEKFILNGRELSWNEVVATFQDKTGRAGPSTWQIGDYPANQADYPVTGVSWFEAAAYAEFAGKSLPTIYHWDGPATTWNATYLAPASNFSGRGMAPVGSYPSLGLFGTYDMAGNAKEWCWNTSGTDRYLMGGSWKEPAYMFTDGDAASPFDRSPVNGIRLVKYLSPPSKIATGPIVRAFRNYEHEKPVSDALFRVFKGLYAYDKAPLNSRIDSVDNSSEYWRKEKVSFDAAYGQERMSAVVFLPKTGRQPYQTVIYYPSSIAVRLRSSDDLIQIGVDFVVRSGRAVIYPILKSTYEREDSPNTDVPSTTISYREHVVDWAKDVGRTIDYAQTRSDLKTDQLAYFGLSWGGAISPIMIAVEDRFKLAVLVGGGFDFQRASPEVDEINFAPRVKIPVLMINGRYDFYYPTLTSQNPMFRLLGTAEKDKRHVVFESGHVPPEELMIKEALDWLDHYQAN